MREKDLQAVTRLLDDPSLEKITSVLVLSPASNINEIETIKTKFPDAVLEIAHVDHWNLENGPHPGGRHFDLIVTCGIVMCAKNPTVWFDHISRSCKSFIVQDLIRGQRGHDGSETDPDTGDVMRFSWTSRGEQARLVGAFDMSTFDDQTVAVEFYSDAPSHSGRDCRKFAALIVSKTPRDEKSPRRGKKS